MTTAIPDVPGASENSTFDRSGEPGIAADSSRQADHRLIIAALVVLVAIAFAFRVAHLGAIGFAEDEVNNTKLVRMASSLPKYLRINN